MTANHTVGEGDPAYQVEISIDPSEKPPHSTRLASTEIAGLVRFVLAAEGVPSAMVGVVFCGDARMAELNGKWLGYKGPTDVITFDLGSQEPLGASAQAARSAIEGEVYVDLAQADRQAAEYGVSADEEVRRLVIHGVLHLIGFDDAGPPGGTERMSRRQEELVGAWDRAVLEAAS